MNYASLRERDKNGRFIKPPTPSSFNKTIYYKEYYLKNKVKRNIQAKEWSKLNPEKRKEIRKRWKSKNRDLVNHYTKLRIYREKNATGCHSLADIEHATSVWGGKCAYCRENVATTVDHVHPLSAGGTNDPSNLVPACVRCNSSKGSKSIWTWDFFWAYTYSRINL